MVRKPPALLALVALLVGTAALAGCATPRENVGDTTGTSDEICAPGSRTGGESNQGEGTTGSGTGDISTADGGDPARTTVAEDCPPSGTETITQSGADGVATGGAGTDGTSTGLGERSGGYSTAPEG